MQERFRKGDRVVYTRDKYSNHPGPRAKNVFASPQGETYAYQVDKYWIVTESYANGQVLLQTRRGKKHTVSADDPRLRKASFWQRLFLANRFPSLSQDDGTLETSLDSSSQSSAA